MLLSIKHQIVIVAFITHCLKTAYSVACLGCVDLDEMSFNRTIQRFPYALIKFDIAFPYGDTHTEFSKLARAASKGNDDLLVATIGIKDYGEMENKALGARFGFHEKNLPGILLFKGNNLSEPIPFPAHLDITESNLKEFINDNTPLFMGCDGCLKKFNLKTKGFANLSTEDQLKIISEFEKLLENIKGTKDETNGKAYVAFARKINQEGYDFVEQETKRLMKLKAGRVTEEKKVEIKCKFNILQLFRVTKLMENVNKSEL